MEVGRLDAPGRPLLFGTTEEFRGISVSIHWMICLRLALVLMEDFKAEAEEEIQMKMNVEV